MRKQLVSFIPWLCLSLLLILTTSWMYAQEEITETDANNSHKETPVIVQNTGDVIDGFPITLNDQTLFKIQTPTGTFTAEERAKTINERIKEVAENRTINLDSFLIEKQENSIRILANNKIIITLTEADAKAARLSNKELAEEYLQIIKNTVSEYRYERTIKYRIFAVLYTLLATLSIFLIFLVLNLIFPRIYNLLNSWRGRYIPALRIQRLELVTADKMTDVIIGFVKFIRLIITLTIIYLYVPLVLSFFPLTRKIGEQLFGYLLAALNFVVQSFINYLPNIFVVALVITTTYYIIRFVKVIFNEVERGNLSFPGFYQDWAKPTYNIILFLIIALAAVVAFPYLPGFDSPAFRGISVFLGILFSLGSTSAVANTVGGIILIYTRSFQIGDRVQIGEVIGDVEEKTLLVTRIRTPKNVLVTLPNSSVLNSSVINFSASARETQVPLILHTTITLGYDLPWRKVHQVLIEAALATDHILSEPSPFVLQTALNDFYVSYEINAYTDQTTEIAQIYSQLHQNIQDYCNQADIEIMSPHYSALRDGNQTTIPANYLPSDYTTPTFRLESVNNPDKHH